MTVTGCPPARKGLATETLVPGLQVVKLSEARRKKLVKFLSKEQCMCSCPEPLLPCLRKRPKCYAARRAARAAAWYFRYDWAPLRVSTRLISLFNPRKLRVRNINVAGRPTMGPDSAPLKLVVFSDFQCPYCAKLPATLHKVLARYKGRIQMVFKHMVMERMHKNGMRAAVAAEAAHRQGKFWPMHDELFKNRHLFPNSKPLSDETLLGMGGKAGLDLKRFKKDLGDNSLEAVVRKDMAEAAKLGLRGTPALFFNGREMTEPRQTLGIVTDWVDEALHSGPDPCGGPKAAPASKKGKATTEPAVKGK